MPAPPLHLSPDLDLDLTDPLVLDLRYPGSVILEQSFGRRFGEIDVGGDLELTVPLVTGSVRSGGTLRVHGEVDAATLHGRELILDGGTIRARALSATERIVIGPGHLKVDVILAPSIEIHPETTGRVTVIESRNPRGPTKVKGGFTLSEYEDLFGDARGFLAERGVGPLADLHAAPDEEPPLVDVDLEPLDDDEVVVLEPIDDLEPIDELEPIHVLEELEPLEDESDSLIHVIGRDSPTARAPGDPSSTPRDDYNLQNTSFYDDEPPPRTLASARDMADEDTLDLHEDDEIILAPSSPPPRAPSPQPAARKSRRPTSPEVERWETSVLDQVSRIAASFHEPPSPVRDLVEAADEGAEAVERALIPVWQELVQQHRRERRPMDPRTSHAFRVLDDLVARAP